MTRTTIAAGLALLAVAAPASAHTMHATADCTTVTTSYTLFAPGWSTSRETITVGTMPPVTTARSWTGPSAMFSTPIEAPPGETLVTVSAEARSSDGWRRTLTASVLVQCEPPAVPPVVPPYAPPLVVTVVEPPPAPEAPVAPPVLVTPAPVAPPVLVTPPPVYGPAVPSRPVRPARCWRPPAGAWRSHRIPPGRRVCGARRACIPGRVVLLTDGRVVRRVVCRVPRRVTRVPVTG